MKIAEQNIINKDQDFDYSEYKIKVDNSLVLIICCDFHHL